MNILIDVLPESVTVDGEEYEIRTDFRTSMLFELLMQDNEVKPQDKTKKALKLYYPVIPANINEAVEAILWFYRCGKEDNPQRQKMNAKKGKTRVYSFEYDDDYIYAAFMTQYGIDLQDIEYLHWWKFQSLFRSLNSSNKIVEIMSYRTTDISQIKSKTEQARIARLQKLYEIPHAMTREEKIAHAGAAFGGGLF